VRIVVCVVDISGMGMGKAEMGVCGNVAIWWGVFIFLFLKSLLVFSLRL